MLASIFTLIYPVIRQNALYAATLIFGMFQPVAPITQMVINENLSAALPDTWQCEATDDGAFCTAAGTWEMIIVLASDDCTAMVSYTIENGILLANGKRERTTPMVETLNVCRVD